ncbi:MAG: chemotaxis response regulator protein-glutamate methylesterase [Pikeienuella sp.]|uniref:protein-glutamate methylesterase/protein-glutamine glutaminase n=1 Tax=Pikeienuella sp. TaxID=2831957 RepID=UPI00391A98FC
MRKTRVLIVDDSRTMRRLIATTLLRDPEVEVVGEAGDPYEAREAIKALSPDVLTLDVEMPGMDGISFLRKLMRLRPTPVVMVSTLTARGAAVAIEALAEGAVECVCKPGHGDNGESFAALPGIVKLAARARLRGPVPAGARPAAVVSKSFAQDRIVMMGASTGGVDALSAILGGWPANCPPTLIVQHMPVGFTRLLAARLDVAAAPRVMEAANGAPLRAGVVYIAPGGPLHLEIDPSGRHCRLVEGPKMHGVSPAVDRLFASAEPSAAKVAAAVLSGMGRDGADGLRALRDAGARTFAQDEGSSVVFGMPRAAAEAGGAERVLPLEKIRDALLRACAASPHPA